MKTWILCVTTLCALAQSAQAEGLSFGGDIAIGQWSNTNGGTGMQSNGGINGTDTRFTGKIGLSVARDFSSFIGQLDLKYQGLEASDPATTDRDDSTQQTLDVTLRGMRDFGSYSAGLFLGYGIHNDNGDSNLPMFYSFIGLDAEKDTGFGSVFGQAGLLTSGDEYDEGPQGVGFVRLGGNYNFASDFTLTGAVSFAKGRQFNNSAFPNRTMGLELGLEKAINDTGLSVYGSYEYTRISFDFNGGRFGDNFSTVWLGLKLDLGGDSKRGGSLPNFGQWVAYNANEIE